MAEPGQTLQNQDQDLAGEVRLLGHDFAEALVRIGVRSAWPAALAARFRNSEILRAAGDQNFIF